MRDSDAQMMEEAEAVRLQRRRAEEETKLGTIGVVGSVVLLFVVPEYLPPPFDGIVMGIGSAILFTLFYFLKSESLRSRRGSLVPARCLLALVDQPASNDG